MKTMFLNQLLSTKFWLPALETEAQFLIPWFLYPHPAFPRL